MTYGLSSTTVMQKNGKAEDKVQPQHATTSEKLMKNKHLHVYCGILLIKSFDQDYTETASEFT